jgi:hypothetical protein
VCTLPFSAIWVGAGSWIRDPIYRTSMIVYL